MSDTMMVERVALALWCDDIGEPGVEDELDLYEPEGPGPYWLRLARVAVETMNEPTGLSVRDLEIGTRSLNALGYSDIHDIDQLRAAGESGKLASVPNIGPKSLQEIYDAYCLMMIGKYGIAYDEHWPGVPNTRRRWDILG